MHISQLSNTFVSDPNQVVKLNQKVKVTVTEVDVARKRIGLTMKNSSEKTQGSAPRRSFSEGGRDKIQGTQGNKPAVKKAEPQNDFQAKLAELKKKFQ